MIKNYDRPRMRERLSRAFHVLLGVTLAALLLIVFVCVWLGCLLTMFFVVGFCLFGLADALGWVLPQEYFTRLVISAIILSILTLVFDRMRKSRPQEVK